MSEQEKTAEEKALKQKILEEQIEASKQIIVEMGSVKSSNIKTIGYNQEHKLVRVEFNNGGIYDYKEVPQEIFEEFKKSESVGSYFSKNIRNNYKCLKVGTNGVIQRSEQVL